ncbi:hypothetical protein [Streptomyces sp. NBC_00083]|nr:hypothetical protein [Streptomyces sp. NBC_00083]MCX5386973.1 hypothetical protein [Streptomyces sp. NBC_00083]
MMQIAYDMDAPAEWRFPLALKGLTALPLRNPVLYRIQHQYH